MRLPILLGLIVCNLVWSAHPLMGKLLLEDFTPAEAAWLRYTSALAAFWFLTLVSFLKNRRPIASPKMSPRDLSLIIFIGAMAFCFAPLLQLQGLQESHATDNALIIAMEPLITVGLAWLFLRQRVSRLYVLSFAVSLLGFSFLAGLSWSGIEIERSHMQGNLIMLLSLIGEAVYVVAGAGIAKRFPTRLLYGRAILSGVIFLTLSVAMMSGQGPLALLKTLAHLHWKSALALFWLGPLGTTGAYIYWMFALSEASVANLALTLFIQPVFGAIWGYTFLHERLTPYQALGGVLILIAVCVQSARVPMAPAL